VRAAADLVYSETLTSIAAQHGRQFSLIQAISRETQPQTLHGRITDLLTSGVLEAQAAARIDPESSHVMLCGNSAMIKDAKQILEARGLIRHRRHAPGHYSAEQYH
jgi:ferredoxin--NADP+ reductase